MKMVDDDAVALKEMQNQNTLETKFISKWDPITGSVGKLSIYDMIPNCMPLSGTAD